MARLILVITIITITIIIIKKVFTEDTVIALVFKVFIVFTVISTLLTLITKIKVNFITLEFLLSNVLIIEQNENRIIIPDEKEIINALVTNEFWDILKKTILNRIDIRVRKKDIFTGFKKETINISIIVKHKIIPFNFTFDLQDQYFLELTRILNVNMV